MRLVFYPPQDNLDSWSMRSSGRQFCHSSCSWRHSRPRAPLESSSRRWTPPRRGTPARCSRGRSSPSQTDRGCGQTSPTKDKYFLSLRRVGQYQGTLTGLLRTRLDRAESRHCAGIIRTVRKVRESVWTFLIAVILSLTLLVLVMSSLRSDCHPTTDLTQLLSHCQGRILQRWRMEATRADFLDYKTGTRCYHHHWEMGDGIIIFLLL